MLEPVCCHALFITLQLLFSDLLMQLHNLPTHSLYRIDDIGQLKCDVAASATRGINLDVHIEALATEVIEDSLPEPFWWSLNFVTNAVDTSDARRCIDEQCLRYELPMFDAGTSTVFPCCSCMDVSLLTLVFYAAVLGTEASLQVILPHKTITYSDMPVEDIDRCLRRVWDDFIWRIDHCIEWSRLQFERLFVIPFTNSQQVLRDPEAYRAATKRAVANVVVDSDRPRTQV